MDLQGYVVTVQTRFEGAKEAAYLATSGADPLVSQFTPSYGMVLNLLQTHTMQEARELVERSFGQYLSNLSLIPKLEESDRLKEEHIAVRAKLGIYDEDDINKLQELLSSYEKLKEWLKEEKRLLKILEKQAEETRLQQISPLVSEAPLCSILSLKGKHVPTAKRANAEPVPAILVAQVPSSGKFPYFLCLG
jgi:superfamily II RNA helicase